MHCLGLCSALGAELEVHLTSHLNSKALHPIPPPLEGSGCRLWAVDPQPLAVQCLSPVPSAQPLNPAPLGLGGGGAHHDPLVLGPSASSQFNSLKVHWVLVPHC